MKLLDPIAVSAVGGCLLAAMIAALAQANCADDKAQAHGAAPRGTLVRIADMSAARAAHTATALADGRVLIVGGFTGEENAGSGVDLFDAGTDRFSPLSGMRTLRHSHTATVLANGKVLIAGGYGAGNAALAAAELFDPATQSFTPTGSLNAARGGHVAVSLRDGRVLIAGGVGPGWTFLASAELYDPATGGFSSTGDMSVARESHIAVRLQDGRVLVVGGHQGRREAIKLFASAETYDPATGVFRNVGDMGTRRHKHDAILLRDGRVLVTGGADERDGDGVYDSTELFDPATGTFRSGPTMKRARYKHQGSAVLLADGRVLIAGGATEAELFDPVGGTFTLVPGDARMAGQFSAVAATGAGVVLVTGGYGNGGGPRASAWLYRP